MTVCLRRGCRAAATITPALEMWGIGYAPGDHPPAILEIDMPLCQAHAGELRAADLLTEGARARVSAALRSAGRVELDFATARLVLRPLAQVN